MNWAHLDTATEVGRRCRDAQTPARTIEATFALRLPLASVRNVAEKSGQSSSFALPIAVAVPRCAP